MLAIQENHEGITPTQVELDQIFVEKYGPLDRAGPSVRAWKKAGYVPPDEHYEALLNKVVTASTRWLDVGCGHSTFPNNPEMSRKLASRCEYLVGIDPDESIHRNPYVHASAQSTLEEYQTAETFDLITLRMVAEHITTPQTSIAALVRLLKPGGIVVLLTPNRWSPLSLMAAWTPMHIHHWLKRLAWGTKEEDTFPVAYRLNSKRQLRRHFGTAGFEEVIFQYVDDCCATWRFPSLQRIEIAIWRLFNRIGFHYPENCILAAFRRSDA
jgi:SAM-dependent methyltransferase